MKALQQALSELGFYKSRVDSQYGGGTVQAVREFQKANKLPVNGDADPVSQELL